MIRSRVFSLSPSLLFKEMSVSISILIYRALQPSMAATSPTLAPSAAPFKEGYHNDYEK